MKNTYQLAVLHTNKSHCYHFLTDFINSHNSALRELIKLRTDLLDKSCLGLIKEKPSIIFKDMFFLGSDVYRVIKVNPNLPKQLG